MTHAIFICIAHLLLDIAVEQYSFISVSNIYVQNTGVCTVCNRIKLPSE